MNQQAKNSPLAEIRRMVPYFNVGISTGGSVQERWSAPYRHWRFMPAEVEYREELTKRKR
jgi:hypothetical protein